MSCLVSKESIFFFSHSFGFFSLTILSEMRVPVVYHKPGACFPIVDNHIRVYAYETDDDGIVIHASIHTIHINEPLSTLRDKYAVKSNVYPHEIEMFYDDKELFDNDTCSQMQITYDPRYGRDREDEGFDETETPLIM
uniref:Phage protein n=2 Tax=Caenorhabditis tropicalis TaxID=1561998 RepID=A0A1I7T9N4_9PELO